MTRSLAASELAEAAEDALVHMLPPPSASVSSRDEYVLAHFPNPAPLWGRAQRLRLPSDGVERATKEVRAWFREKGREQFQWWIGSHARPANLRERLQRAGAEPAEDAHLEVMVLTREPPAVDDIELRRVRSRADFDRQREIRLSAFPFTDEQKQAMHARAADAWAEYRAHDAVEQVLAYVDGQPVAAAGVLLSGNGVALLLGGATLSQARGRGAYRALVRARWELAQERGARAVAVHAGRMSQPILARLGFRTVGAIDLLTDNSRRD